MGAAVDARSRPSRCGIGGVGDFSTGAGTRQARPSPAVLAFCEMNGAGLRCNYYSRLKMMEYRLHSRRRAKPVIVSQRRALG